MPRMLRGIAFGLRASQLEFPARNANHDGAVLLAPELLAALRVAPERTEPARGSGDALHQNKRNAALASLLDPRDRAGFTPRCIPHDNLPLTDPHPGQGDWSIG